MNKCKYGCGYEHEKKNAVQLHERNCKKRNKDKGDREKGNNESDCLHSWKPLQKVDYEQVEAINHGYKEVCRRCQELR